MQLLYTVVHECPGLSMICTVSISDGTVLSQLFYQAVVFLLWKI